MPPKRKASQPKKNCSAGARGAKVARLEATARKNHGKSQYYAFVMANGKVDCINSLKDALQFEEDNGGIIISKHEFTTKAEVAAFKKSCRVTAGVADESPVSGGIPSPQKMTKREKSKLDRLLARIESDRPADRLEVAWKTSTKSKACVIILRFLTKDGKDDWRIKGDHNAIALRNYAKTFEQQSKPINDALTHMEWGRMRDLGGDARTVKVNAWTSPSSQKSRDFPCFVPFSYFSLPVDKLDSEENETTFITSSCTAIGTAILQIMRTETYKRCLERATGNEALWRGINDPSNDNKNYLTFVNRCKVKVVKCDNFNKHLVLDDANKLVTILYDNNQQDPKYKVDESDDGLSDSDWSFPTDKVDNKESNDSSGENDTDPKPSNDKTIELGSSDDSSEISKTDSTIGKDSLLAKGKNKKYQSKEDSDMASGVFPSDSVKKILAHSKKGHQIPQKNSNKKATGKAEPKPRRSRRSNKGKRKLDEDDSVNETKTTADNKGNETVADKAQAKTGDISDDSDRIEGE